MTSATFDGRSVLRVLAVLLVIAVPAHMGCDKEKSGEPQTAVDKPVKQKEKRGAVERKKDSGTKEQTLLDKLELGKSPEEIQQILGEPVFGADDRVGDRSRRAHFCDKSFLGKFGSPKLVFKYGELVYVKTEEKLGDRDPRDRFKELVRLAKKTFGEPDIKGLRWHTPEPPHEKAFDQPLNEEVRDGSLREMIREGTTGPDDLVARWESNESQVLVEVASSGKFATNFNHIKYTRKDSLKADFFKEYDPIPFPEEPWIQEPFSSLHGLTYTVERVALLETDGNAVEPTSEDKRRIRVDYALENTTGSKKTPGKNRVLLESSQMDLYHPSSQRRKDSNADEAEDATRLEIEPGAAKDLVAIFEVPVKAAQRFNLLFPKGKGSEGPPVRMPFGWPTISEQD